MDLDVRRNINDEPQEKARAVVVRTLKETNMELMLRSLLVWFVIIAAEICHGIARAAFLEPYVGGVRARQIGVFTGSLIIVTIAVVFVRWIGAATRRELLAVGFLWLVLTLAFELLFGGFVVEYSWKRLLSDYNPAEGGFLAVGMIVLALAPLIAAKIRRIQLT